MVYILSYEEILGLNVSVDDMLFMAVVKSLR